jgi:hypothetical protein
VRIQRDWGFGGLAGWWASNLSGRWLAEKRQDFPGRGRLGGFVSSCLPLVSNGSSVEQGRFRVVDWLMSRGVRINGR